MTGFCNILLAQNPTVVEKSAPRSNNTLPDPGLSSNSGINPMGNPGTMNSSTSSSAATNQTLESHPNIEPGTFLTSSPGGTVSSFVSINGPVVQKTATAVNNTGGTTVVSTADNGNTIITVKKSPDPVIVAKTLPDARPNNTQVINTELAINSKAKVMPGGYTPVLGNYVPTETINRIKNKYGNTVYDIRTVKVSATNKIGYIVRIVEDGKFRDELYFDLP